MVEETLSSEGELEKKIEKIDEDSNGILVKDGMEFDMLEKIKDFFSKFPVFFKQGDKKKGEL